MKCQRDKFLLQRKYAYLNGAYMSPLMKKVENAGIKGLKKKRKPFHITPEDFFKETETVRRLYAQLIDTKEPERIVVVPSVSYGMANVAKNIPFKKGEIIVAGEQFPSNYYPWKPLEKQGLRLHIVFPKEAEKRGDSWNEAIIESINENTRAVAIGHVHWADGTLFDLAQIRERLDEVGGWLIVDGTQSVGAMPFSIAKYRPDALVCAGYKWLMGPYAIGLAYYGPAFDNGQPIEENWTNRQGSHDFAGLVNYQDRYGKGALRYEVGEHSHFIAMPMMHEALKQLIRWKPENIQEYCKKLTAEAIGELQEIGYRIEESGHRSEHLFGIRAPSQINMQDLKNSFKKHRVSVSVRGEAIRVAPHVYNDETDTKKLLKAMKAPIFAT